MNDSRKYAHRLAWTLLAAGAWLLVLLDDQNVAASESPNLVVIFIDDMGYADVPPFGSPAYATPSISQLAAEGRSFTDFQVSSAVCSASRAALLTGCYHARLGIHGAFGPNARVGLNPDEITLAEVCRSRGYATACFGKWHLGHLPPFLPTQQGFDEYFGLPYSNDMWPFHPDLLNRPMEERFKVYPPLPLFSGMEIVDSEVTSEDQRQLTKQYTEHAVDFIQRHQDEPFFLYLAHSMVHVPLHASEAFDGKSGAGLFGDVVQEIDWSVGQILQALRAADIDDRTLVVFTSDNGPWLSYGTHSGVALPLREGKGTSFEGGFRVPAIMRWPDRIPAGTSCDALAATIDLLPTFAALIGADLPQVVIDGKDIRPLIFGDPEATTPHHSYCYYYENNQLQAIRNERWKLHFTHRYRTLDGRVGRNDGLPIPYDHAEIGPALFDLDSDPSESTDVSDRHPDIVAQLAAEAEKYRAELGDTLTKRKGSGVRPVGRVPKRPRSEDSASPAAD